MFKSRWFAVSAFICAAILPMASAVSQDDLFGTEAASEPAAKAADPAAAAVEALEGGDSIRATTTRNEAVTENKGDFCRCVGESNSEAVARIEKALNGTLVRTGMDYTETPLEEVSNLIQQEYNIPIQINAAALKEIGHTPDVPITVNLHNVSLRSALRLMLAKLQLTYVIQDEVLMITTPEEAESQLMTCVYNVRGFLSDTSGKSMDSLIDTIVSCVATETWAENGGGESEIRPLEPGLLVISQTQAVHEEISNLLKAIGDMRSAEPVAAAMNRQEELVTRGYQLQIDVDRDDKELRKQVRELVTQSLPNEQWDGKLADGQPVMLTILDDRVIVRHKPSVQDLVESILVDSGLAQPENFCGSKQIGTDIIGAIASESGDAESGDKDERSNPRKK